VHKPASIWAIVPEFCTILPYHLTDFQFLQNVTNFIFPHYYLLTCWRTALTPCVMSRCVDKQKMLSEEDRVLIKVLRVEKRIWYEKNNEWIYAISGILQERVYRCWIRDVDHLKERLIEQWRHVDHGIIDRAVNQWRKWRWRCTHENGRHF